MPQRLKLRPHPKIPRPPKHSKLPDRKTHKHIHTKSNRPCSKTHDMGQTMTNTEPQRSQPKLSALHLWLFQQDACFSGNFLDFKHRPPQWWDPLHSEISHHASFATRRHANESTRKESSASHRQGLRNDSLYVGFVLRTLYPFSGFHEPKTPKEKMHSKLRTPNQQTKITLMKPAYNPVRS